MNIKKKCLIAGVILFVFLLPWLTSQAMILRPYIQYKGVISAVRDSSLGDLIKNIEMSLDPYQRSALTKEENYTDYYENEYLAIRIVLKDDLISEQEAVVVGEMVKGIVDDQIRNVFAQATGLEKRVHVFVSPFAVTDTEESDYKPAGRLVYYRIWNFDAETFEWLLDGNSYIYNPEERRYGGAFFLPEWFKDMVYAFPKYFEASQWNPAGEIRILVKNDTPDEHTVWFEPKERFTLRIPPFRDTELWYPREYFAEKYTSKPLLIYYYDREGATRSATLHPWIVMSSRGVSRVRIVVNDDGQTEIVQSETIGRGNWEE
jgi:hypothetical protein